MYTRHQEPQSLSCYRANAKLARSKWGHISRESLRDLKHLTRKYKLSVGLAHLILLQGKWYVTHSGLLAIARRCRCFGIDTKPAARYCDLATSRWTFKATVYKSRNCKGFAGYGDADPSNVSPVVRGAEMRVAETRAVNRALRKAYGIGLCSVEELGSFSGPLPPAAGQKQPARVPTGSNGNGHHPLRDRLCLLIRQHQLDPALVKAYAADYCDVSELRQASRVQIATFIKHLAEYAQGDRDGLLCQLNSYAPKPVSASSTESTGDPSNAEPEKAAGAA